MKEALLTQMNDFEGGADNFLKYVSEHYSYIEVQLWDDSVIFQNNFSASAAHDHIGGIHFEQIFKS